MLGSGCSQCCPCADIPWDMCSSVEVTLTGQDVLEQYEASKDTSLTSTKGTISRGLKGSQYSGTFSLTKTGTAVSDAESGAFRRSIWRYSFTQDNCDNYIEAVVYNTTTSNNYLCAITFRGQVVQYYDWTGGRQYKALSEMQCSSPQSVSAGGVFRYESYSHWRISSLTRCSDATRFSAVSGTEITLNNMALNVCSAGNFAPPESYAVACNDSPHRASVAYGIVWPQAEPWGWSGALNVNSQANQWRDGFGTFTFNGNQALPPTWLRWRFRNASATIDTIQLKDPMQRYVGQTWPNAVDFVSLTIRM